jgi:hypothetical protein
MVTASVNMYPHIHWYLNQSIHRHFLTGDDIFSVCLNFSNNGRTALEGSKEKFFFILSEYE